VLKKDLKNVSERNCPFSNLKIEKVYSLPKDTAEIETGIAEKSSLWGPGKQTAKTWFGLEKWKEN
jgi:hypothetical protein